MRGYSETFWNLFSETPVNQLSHVADTRERRRGGERRRHAYDKFVRALSVRNFVVYRVGRSPLYLFKQKVNKPSRAFDRLEREAVTPPRTTTPPFSATRAIFNAKVSTRVWSRGECTRKLHFRLYLRREFSAIITEFSLRKGSYLIRYRRERSLPLSSFYARVDRKKERHFARAGKFGLSNRRPSLYTVYPF